MTRHQPPRLFSLAKWMNRNGIRGGYRLLDALTRSGVLDGPVLYDLGRSVRIEVPIARYHWDRIDLLQYEGGLMALLQTWIAGLTAPVTLVDAGADIGLFSLRAVSLCPSIERIIAFEPSAGSCAFLERNLDRLRIRTEAINKALSDFEGRGELERPEYDTSDCGRYLAMSPDGSIEVTTLDSMLRDSAPALVVKLDIEGGELAALKGATHTLRSAENVIVVMEAHPKVTQRTGIDPIECLRLLNSWRPFRFVVDQKPAAPISLDQAIFHQLTPDRVYNILGRSTGPGS